MKTSKKLLSIVIAVALLISSLAVVASFSGSAETTKVSVFNGTIAKCQAQYADCTTTNTVNEDGSVNVVFPATKYAQQYQIQLFQNALDKAKITAAGGSVKIDFTVNKCYKNADNSTTDSGYFKTAGFTADCGSDGNWVGIGKTYTGTLDCSGLKYDGSTLQLVFQNYGGSGLYGADVTFKIYVEEGAAATTTAAPASSETVVYSFVKANQGDTFKTEGWIAAESYWGPTADLVPSYAKDGSVSLATEEGKANFYSQLNAIWKNVPVTTETAYVTFTNNSAKAVKLKVATGGYTTPADADVPVVAAGKSLTIELGVLTGGNIQFWIMNNGGTLDVGDNQYTISGIYTKGAAATTATTATTTVAPVVTTTVAPTTAPVATTGTVYCGWKAPWYSKGDNGSNNFTQTDLEENLTNDANGIHYAIPESLGKKSRQFLTNWSMDSTEKTSGKAALTEAMNGSKKLQFTFTLNSTKAAADSSTSHGLKVKYSVCGVANSDATAVLVKPGKSATITVDVSGVTDIATAAAKGVSFWLADEYWTELSAADFSISKITVVPGEAPATTATTTSTTTTPTTATTPIPTTTGSTPSVSGSTVYCNHLQYWYGKTEGWMTGASNIGELADYITVKDGVLNIKIDADAEMKSQQIQTLWSMDGKEKTSATKALTEAMSGSKQMYATITVNAAKDGNGKDATVGYKYQVAGCANTDATVIALPVGQTVTVVYDVSSVTDIATAAAKGLQHYFKNFNEWGVGLSILDVTISPVKVVDGNAPATTATTTATTTTTTTTTTTEAPASLVTDKEFPAYDAAKFNVTLGDYTGKAGDVISVPVTIANNPGIWGGVLSLKYDQKFMTPVVDASSNVIATAGTVFTQGELLTGPVNPSKDGFSIISLTYNSTSLTENKTANGVIATIQFKLNADVKAGDKSAIVYMDYANAPFINADGDDVIATYKDASITVEDAPVVTETTATEPVVTETTRNALAVPSSDPEFAAYDASKFNITLGSYTGKAGEVIEVPITIDNNPGIWGTMLNLEYNPLFMTPVMDASGNVEITAGTVYTQGELLTGPANDAADEGMQMITITAQRTAFDDTAVNGVIGTIKFTLAQDVVAGDVSKLVYKDYANTPFINANGDDVVATYGEGTFTVEAAPVVTTIAPTTVAPTTAAPVVTTVAPTAADKTTTTVSDATTTTTEATTTAADDDENPSTGAAAAPIAALALAAGAAFVAFKARKK